MKEKKEKEKKQKEKKKKEPEYIEKTGLLNMGYDYNVYHMTQKDYLVSWSIGFAAAYVVSMAFFSSAFFSLICGVICAVYFPRYYKEYQRKKILNVLREQFKDLLESISTSYSAGKNTVNAFANAEKDLIDIYGEDADIVNEVKIINIGLKNNINVENLLVDFAERSGLDDVMSFADVFEVCNRQGGDLKRVVTQTRDVINDKIEIEMEIETLLASNKNELNIMMVMPVIIVLALRGMLSDANSLTTIVVKLVCLGIFALAYVMGRKIIDIKV